MSDELLRLVEQLGDIERRIGELTGGKLDTVILGSLGPVLLPEAQRHVLRSEAEQRQFARERAAILDALPAQVALLALDGRISFVNKAWREFAVANALPGDGHAVGQNYVDVCERARGNGAAEAREVAAGLRSVLHDAAESYSAAYDCDGPDGKRWFELLAAPMPRSSGHGAVVMHIDVTKRRRAEEALRASEAEFRNLAEAMPQIVWTTSPDGRATYFNRQWMDYTGLTLAESVGESWSEPFHPADRERAQRAWQHAADTIGAYGLECRLRAADGTYRWWLIRGVPVQDAGGAVLKWLGTFTDINEFKQSQTRLRDQAALLDKAQDAIIVLDLEWRILYWNAGAERIYGWRSYEALGRSFVGVAVVDRAAYEEAMRATLADGEWFGELEQHTRDGKGIIVESRRSLLLDERQSPKSILVINTDVTQRRAVEAQLRQAQRLEAVGQLTGGVAHDFNNILMVIMANVDSLLDSEGLPGDAVQHLEQIGQAAQRATNLTRQLLAYSRKQKLKLERTNLNDLVVSTGALLRRTLGEHIEVDSLLAEDLWPTSTDRGQVEAALVNLCVNARDAMPRGGRLLIETRNATFDKDYVAGNPDAVAGDYVMLSVTDTGTGMPPEVLAKVFEPFFTTKDVGKGTGLGLSMVYGFAKQSKGHVTIHSEVGDGTAVRLYLPRDEGAATSETVRQAVVPRGTERVLVVEDEEQVRNSVVVQLRSLGYAVSAAASGSEGLVILRAGQSFDLLLTDVVMPGPLNGRGLADEARRLCDRQRVLFMSGYPEDAISTQGVLDLGVRLLSKPFRKIDLAKAVRQALDGDPQEA